MKPHNPYSPEELRLIEADESEIIARLDDLGLRIRDLNHVCQCEITKPVAAALSDMLLGLRSEPAIRCVVAGLTDRVARGIASQPLIQLFRRVREVEKQDSYRWSIGNALHTVAVQSDVDDLLALVTDKSYGSERQMIAWGLGRLAKDPRVVPTLISLLDDDDVIAHALCGLQRARAHEAREPAMALVAHERPLVRKQVASLIRVLDRDLLKQSGETPKPRRKRPPRKRKRP